MPPKIKFPSEPFIETRITPEQMTARALKSAGRRGLKEGVLRGAKGAALGGGLAVAGQMGVSNAMSDELFVDQYLNAQEAKKKRDLLLYLQQQLTANDLAGPPIELAPPVNVAKIR